MSTQRGNVNKSRSQKHQNTTKFKNNLHGVKNYNDTSITSVCLRCKDIIEWKIKYNKYKPLSVPKRCTICNQKTVTQAYHILCKSCVISTGHCAKCGKEEFAIKPELSQSEKDAEGIAFDTELNLLPERKNSLLYSPLEWRELGHSFTVDEMGLLGEVHD
ncbi:uncharacterized protein C9orf85 homolog [Centruroides sculpturatus]|uniref:uncharacterized protein C9orf85 homolog n=1 Tax=Centruroides sculpturatus TaxID=218467 RepID=UPI000C6D59D7|nr:uncharacterized protein C9orf85 homolog [Centruroides sculpturatus]